MMHTCRSRDLASSLAVLLAAAGIGGAQEPPTADYYVYAAAESQDEVSLIRFGPGGAEIVKTIKVGLFPLETDGPHGLALAPDGSHWFVSIAHGRPFGQIHKYATGTDRKVGAVEVGLFPASMQLSAAGLLFVVNFNLHGDVVPSTISVVETDSMIELARITTCAMPHGSRLTADGARHYSVCTRDEQLVEVDARALKVRRRLYLTPGHERELEPDVTEAAKAQAEDSSARGPGRAGGGGDREAPAPRCGPTWVQPSPDGAFVYVACNKNKEVLEVDVAKWRIARRFATGPGPYNLDLTPDGRLLVVTYKGGQAVGVWDLAEGRELGAVPSSRRLPHGIAIAPDSRYAFVSVEGVGGEPGTVDIIDLETFRQVASVDMGKQAGGIVFWRLADSKERGE